MRGSKALRQQVLAEVKLRQYFWNTVLSLALIYMMGSMIFGDMGLLRYLELRDRQITLEQELDAVTAQNMGAAQRLQALGSDDFYIEKNARESFGMATEDEYIFIYK